jgi:ABC-type transporter Mla subunit MlaD
MFSSFHKSSIGRIPSEWEKTVDQEATELRRLLREMTAVSQKLAADNKTLKKVIQNLSNLKPKQIDKLLEIKKEKGGGRKKEKSVDNSAGLAEETRPVYERFKNETGEI